MKSILMVRESDAVWGGGGGGEKPFAAGSVVAMAVGLVEEIPMYWTPTCWRSNWGFLGLRARMMTRTTARIRRAMKEKRRKRQQQQPLKEAEDEEEEWDG